MAVQIYSPDSQEVKQELGLEAPRDPKTFLMALSLYGASTSLMYHQIAAFSTWTFGGQLRFKLHTHTPRTATTLLPGLVDVYSELPSKKLPTLYIHSEDAKGLTVGPEADSTAQTPSTSIVRPMTLHSSRFN